MGPGEIRNLEVFVKLAFNIMNALLEPAALDIDLESEGRQGAVQDEEDAHGSNNGQAGKDLSGAGSKSLAQVI